MIARAKSRREIADAHSLRMSSLRKQGPIRRGGNCESEMVDGFASTTTDCGYGSLLSQGRRWKLQRLALQQPRHFAGQPRGLADEQALQRRGAGGPTQNQKPH